MPDQIRSPDAKRRASDALLWTAVLNALPSTTLSEHLNLPVPPLVRAVLKCHIINRGWGLLEIDPQGRIQACCRAAGLRGLPQGGKHTRGNANWNSRDACRLLGGHINWMLWPLFWGEWVARAVEAARTRPLQRAVPLDRSLVPWSWTS